MKLIKIYGWLIDIGKVSLIGPVDQNEGMFGGFIVVVAGNEILLAAPEPCDVEARQIELVKAWLEYSGC